MVVGALTHCALLNSVCDLTPPPMNRQHSRIRDLMLYKFELGHNGAEVTKNICCAKDKGAVDHTVQ